MYKLINDFWIFEKIKWAAQNGRPKPAGLTVDYMLSIQICTDKDNSTKTNRANKT